MDLLQVSASDVQHLGVVACLLHQIRHRIVKVAGDDQAEGIGSEPVATFVGHHRPFVSAERRHGRPMEASTGVPADAAGSSRTTDHGTRPH